MAITGTEGLVLLVARVLLRRRHRLHRAQSLHADRIDDGLRPAQRLPAPKLAVLGSGLALILGGLAIVPRYLTGGGRRRRRRIPPVAGVLFHDFWAVPEDQQQEEMTHFLKNVALAGGALALAVLAAETWAFSVGLGAF